MLFLKEVLEGGSQNLNRTAQLLTAVLLFGSRGDSHSWGLPSPCRGLLPSQSQVEAWLACCCLTSASHPFQWLCFSVAGNCCCTWKCFPPNASGPPPLRRSTIDWTAHGHLGTNDHNCTPRMMVHLHKHPKTHWQLGSHAPEQSPITNHSVTW